MGFEDLVELDVSFKDGAKVHIEITGYNTPEQVIKALEKLGRSEYLISLYSTMTGVDEDEEWDE